MSVFLGAKYIYIWGGVGITFKLGAFILWEVGLGRERAKEVTAEWLLLSLVEATAGDL